MKMKRLISLVIVLLLVCGMPVSAFADNLPNCGTGETVETIGSDNTMFANNGTVTTNNGILHSNCGTVTNNNATVVTNSSEGGIVTNNNEGATVSINRGTVETNNGSIVSSTGKVTENNGTVDYAESGSEIITNNGAVEKQNLGTVKTNNGTVNNNYGTVEINSADGTVTNQKGGTVTTNNGTVSDNANGGTVKTNSDTGTVTTNSGTVGKNYGTIETNEYDGAVGIVHSADRNAGNYTSEAQHGNFGTITTNYGIVTDNGGTDGIKTDNTGIIVTNAEDGVVIDNSSYGTINNNQGTVMFNSGTVGNNTGTVQYNCGTVTNVDGTLYEYIYTDGETENIKAITNAGTYYGITVYEGQLGVGEDYEDCFNGAAILQRQDGESVDLTKLFTQEGCEITGYYVNGGDNPVSGTTYNVNKAPAILSLVWSRLKAIITSGTEPVLAYDLPDSVAAGDVQIGTDVKINGVIFRVIDMDDDSITVVTMCGLSDEDYADPMAFLAKYLSAQQLELLLNSPERISDELASILFGGNTEHLIFKAAKNLFE